MKAQTVTDERVSPEGPSLKRGSAAEAILDCLREEGVGHVFGLAGSSFLDLLDAFHDVEGIEYVGVRHEQAAAHMADGYARAKAGSGANLGVCVATSGPGVTNLVTGVATAQHCQTPLIVIGGAVRSLDEYRGSKQEVDQLSLFRPVTKEVVRISDPERAPELMRHAARTALEGQPGPVYVDIPKDVFGDEIAYRSLPPESYRADARSAPTAAAVAATVELLREARRPLIVAGAEFKRFGGSASLVALAEALDVPVVTSAGHRDVFPNDHRLFFGQLGLRGSPLAQEIGRNADVVLALGTRLAYQTTAFGEDYLGPQARIVQCGVDGRQIGRHRALTLGFVADAVSTAESLTVAAKIGSLHCAAEAWRSWTIDRRTALAAARAQLFDKLSRPIRSDRFYAELGRATPPETQVVIDAGYWGGRAHDAFHHLSCPSLYTPLDFRCIGAALSMALGVEFARPGTPVLTIHGDGGFVMNLQELETAVRFGLKPVVVVLNNFAWGAEKRHQKRSFGSRFVGSDYTNPALDALAESFGCRGLRITDAGDLGDALAESWKADCPTVIDVIVDPEEI